MSDKRVELFLLSTRREKRWPENNFCFLSMIVINSIKVISLISAQINEKQVESKASRRFKDIQYGSLSLLDWKFIYKQWLKINSIIHSGWIDNLFRSVTLNPLTKWREKRLLPEKFRTMIKWNQFLRHKHVRTLH